jgi:hypothetical protein
MITASAAGPIFPTNLVFPISPGRLARNDGIRRINCSWTVWGEAKF